VVPAWDLGDVLVECLESLVQPDERARIVVVDNASSEPLPMRPEVEPLRLPDRVSVGEARNAGLAVVDTPYVLFMDGDDVLLPGALRHLVSALDFAPHAVAASGRAMVWDPQSGGEEPARWPFAWTHGLARRPRLFALVNCVRNVFPTTGPVAIRTDAARATGGFCDANWAEDWCLGVELCLQGPVVPTNRVCARYRVDSRRTTLSDLKEGRWAPSWAGRKRIRRRLRTTAHGPRVLRTAPWLLTPLHTFYVVQDLLVARQLVSQSAP
jgi:glycosyltransferase involved in cell wall biosynthesis